MYNTSNISTTIFESGKTDVYLNTLSNIHDVSSLINFYDLMFGTHPFVLITTIFVGLYLGVSLIQYRHKKVVIKNV